jgi:hypothetical protein
LGEGFWTILEQEDFYRLRHFKWVVDGNGHNLYAVRLKISGPNKTRVVSMHREIMNANDRRFVDHRNCDSLDNRKSNLRFATQAENMRNRRKIKNTSSRFIGAYFEKQRKSWLVQIRRNGKKIFIGRFKNEIDAAKAYDEAAKKYHGEFARLNFPPESEESRALFARIGKMWRSFAESPASRFAQRSAVLLWAQRSGVKRRGGVVKKNDSEDR